MWTIQGFLRCALVCALAALAGCSSSGPDPYKPDVQPAAWAGAEIVSGNHQTAPVGTELPQALVGRVIDAGGKPLSNRAVTFVVTGGGGRMSVGSTTSDSKGLFSGRWTLGPEAGTQRVEVRGGDVAGATIYASFESVATAGAAMSATAIQETQRQAAKSSTAIPTPAAAMTNSDRVTTTFWTLSNSAGTQQPSESIEGLPFEFDGDFVCHFADAPDAPYPMSVRLNSVSVGDSRDDVGADGSFELEWWNGDDRRQLQGRLEFGIDRDVMATGSTIDPVAPTPWSCERL